MLFFFLVVFVLFCFFILKLELAKKQGVSMNCHYVTTADGYILRLYHIPTPAQNQSSNNRTNALKPMLFMHGLQSSSLDFVFYPNSSAGECSVKVFEFIDHIIHCRQNERRCSITQKVIAF